jgi:hypothetical protein
MLMIVSIRDRRAGKAPGSGAAEPLGVCARLEPLAVFGAFSRLALRGFFQQQRKLILRRAPGLILRRAPGMATKTMALHRLVDLLQALAAGSFDQELGLEQVRNF